MQTNKKIYDSVYFYVNFNFIINIIYLSASYHLKIKWKQLIVIIIANYVR